MDEPAISPTFTSTPTLTPTLTTHSKGLAAFFARIPSNSVENLVAASNIPKPPLAFPRGDELDPQDKDPRRRSPSRSSVTSRLRDAESRLLRRSTSVPQLRSARIPGGLRLIASASNLNPSCTSEEEAVVAEAEELGNTKEPASLFLPLLHVLPENDLVDAVVHCNAECHTVQSQEVVAVHPLAASTAIVHASDESAEKELDSVEAELRRWVEEIVDHAWECTAPVRRRRPSWNEPELEKDRQRRLLVALPRSSALLAKRPVTPTYSLDASTCRERSAFDAVLESSADLSGEDELDDSEDSQWRLKGTIGTSTGSYSESSSLSYVQPPSIVNQLPPSPPPLPTSAVSMLRQLNARIGLELPDTRDASFWELFHALPVTFCGFASVKYWNGKRTWKRVRVQIRRNLLCLYEPQTKRHAGDPADKPLHIMALEKSVTEIAHAYRKRPHVLSIRAATSVEPEQKGKNSMVQQWLLQPEPATQESMLEWAAVLRKDAHTRGHSDVILAMLGKRDDGCGGDD